jgi:hypothetical protein
MKREKVGTGVEEFFDIKLRLVYHQVGVELQFGPSPQGLDRSWTEGDVRGEVAVDDVEVHLVRAAFC